MNREKLKIMYVGSLNVQSNSYRRFKTLKELGHEVEGVDSDKYIYDGPYSRFHHHFNIGPGVNQLNKMILEQFEKLHPDILFVDNKSFVKGSVIRRIRKKLSDIKIINLITDDPTGKFKYAWRISLKTAPLYDCHFVQRKVNIDELKKYGAQRVELCFRSYDPSFNRPIELDEAEKEKYQASVGFIGTYEENREDFVAFLIQNNIQVQVTGDGWSKGKHWNIIEPNYHGVSVYGDAYIKSINGMTIALHFLRHANRDDQDSRSFEIPACGVFMLAERSDVHSSLFEEDVEAVFFSTKKELLEKVNYYLQHEAERMVIANNGLQRCRNSDYTHAGRLKEVIKKIYE